MEYGGPGAATLSVPERATITNMGAELGATASIFPSDERTREFLAAMGREEHFQLLAADEGAEYDEVVNLDLSGLEPLVAQPHMPDRVAPVKALAGLKVDQAAVGSCTNSSYADLKTSALMLRDRRVRPETDLFISPGSKQVLEMLAAEGLLRPILASGARLLECACGPCIGMGGSPPSGGVSVRTFNRNFEGRSGTKDAQVYLGSPWTAVQAALSGELTDPAGWGEPPEQPDFPESVPDIRDQFVYPPEDGSEVEVLRGPNIVPLEEFEPPEAELRCPVALKLGDDVTTDHIMPAGAEITALRSNVPAIAEYVFSRVDPDFVARIKRAGRGVVVAGENYGQGSSREHAALAPRHLGVKAVLAKSFARIHRANLVNFGILPLIFKDKADYETILTGEELAMSLRDLEPGGGISVRTDSGGRIHAVNDLSAKELEIIRAGGLLNYVAGKRGGH
jgi:aconitate hydratase